MTQRREEVSIGVLSRQEEKKPRAKRTGAASFLHLSQIQASSCIPGKSSGITGWVEDETPKPLQR
jgi:hypothetical protein